MAARDGAAADEGGAGRAAALREMTVRYRELMHSNLPVHAWPEA